MLFVLKTCVSERFTLMGWGPENGVFKKVVFFLLADFLGLHARETTVSATFFVNFSSKLLKRSSELYLV